MAEVKKEKNKLEKYYKKYGDDKTRWFLENGKKAGLDGFINPIMNLYTKDRNINLLHEFNKKKTKRLIKYLEDVICGKIEGKLLPYSDSKQYNEAKYELKKTFLGVKGARGKRSALAFPFTAVLTRYVDDWKKRQVNRVNIPKTIHVVKDIPPVWKGWKKLRDEVCPNFNLRFDPDKDKTIKIMPNDVMTPKERINNLIDFKDADRVGLGLSLSHTVSFMGAQPKHGIGGLWQYTFGPGENIAKMVINTWIRLGGLDFMPAAMSSYLSPLPEPHSTFYYDWAPPSDTIYEQFLEKELIKNYDRIYDWGLTSLAKEISKGVLYWWFTGIREALKANMIISKYFGKPFNEMFQSYAGSIAALWDVIPIGRGMIPFMKELRKNPDGIIEIFEFLEPGLTEFAIGLARLTKTKYILLGNSRGASTWISPKTFENIFWPTQKRTWEKIVNAGFKVCAHLDNDWTENMELMLELPKHSGFFHLDQSDLVKVREIVGDHFCLMGNLQPSITTGSGPDTVYKETKRLIEGCGKEGGFIVATGCEAPANIPVENYYAMKRAIIDHGYFKR